MLTTALRDGSPTGSSLQPTTPTSATTAAAADSSVIKPAKTSSSRSYHCSLRWLFIGSSAAQVIIACIVVWYLGYQSQIDTANSLSVQLRAETLSHIVDQVSLLLSNPILAVTEINFANIERASYVDPAGPQVFDYSLDYVYFTALANAIKHYPGTTATVTATNGGVYAAVILDLIEEPLRLLYELEDATFNFNITAWYSTYNFTLTAEDLSNDIAALTDDPNFFNQIPTADLTTARFCPKCLLLNSHWVDVSSAETYQLALDAANKAISTNTIGTAYQYAWVLPENSDRSAESLALAIQVSYPHINAQPNITLLQLEATEALKLGSPRAQWLQQQVNNLTEEYAMTHQISPFVDFISVVTYNTAVMQDFLLTHLPSFVTTDGAAFIVTDEAYLIASTLSNSDINVVFNISFFINNAAFVEQESAKDPSGMSFIQDLYATVINWGDKDPNDRPTQFEDTRHISGDSYYIQFSSLPTPSSNFGVLLIVYSRVSDYQGNLSTNTRTSLLLSLLVLVVSLVFTFCLTQCVHTPLMTVIAAMQLVVDRQNDPKRYSKRAHKASETGRMAERERYSRWSQPLTVSGDNEVPKSSQSEFAFIPHLTGTGASPSGFESPASSPLPTIAQSPYGAARSLTVVAAQSASNPPFLRKSDSMSISRSASQKSHGDGTGDGDGVGPYSDVSAVELDKLLQKWRRTMLAQGLQPPIEWTIPVAGLTAVSPTKKEENSVSRPETSISITDSDDSSFTTEVPSCCVLPCSHLCLTPQQRQYALSQCGSSSELVDLQLTFGHMLYRLRNSQVSLERANQAKRQFLRFVFHEVRVPLNALGLGVEQLTFMFEEQEHNQRQRSQPPPADDQLSSSPPLSYTDLMSVDKYGNDGKSASSSIPLYVSNVTSDELSPLQLLSIIEDQVSTVTRILNDVLSFQRIEDGELALEMNEFNVATMIHNTLHSFQSEIKQKQLSLQCQFQLYSEEMDPAFAPLVPRRFADDEEKSDRSSSRMSSRAPMIPHQITSSTPSQQYLHTLGRSDSVQSVELSNFRAPADPVASPRLLSHTSSVSNAKEGGDEEEGQNGLVVIGDQYRLRQVLSNFVSNAIKFTPANGRITVSARITRDPPFDSVLPDEVKIPVDDSDGGHGIVSPRASSYRHQALHPAASPLAGHLRSRHGWLSISVADSGVGITRANLQSLFQAYRQIDPGELQQGKGSGLGLSICKKLIELHGGQVHAHSRHGSGSTFSFTVPTTIIHLDRNQDNIVQTLYAPPPQPPQTANTALSVTFADIQHDDVISPLIVDAAELSPSPVAADAQAPLAPLVVDPSRPRTTLSASPINPPRTLLSQQTVLTPSSLITTISPSVPPDTAADNILPAAPAELDKFNADGTSSINFATQKVQSRRLSDRSQRAPSSSSSSTALPSQQSVNTTPLPLLRCLVVEDSSINRKLLVMMLGSMGSCKVIDSCENGKLCVDLFTAALQEYTAHRAGREDTALLEEMRWEPYDIVFLDDNMPVMTGVECIAHLRAMGVRHTSVFGVTGNALAEDQRKFIRAGVNEVFIKPVSKPTLLRALQQVRHQIAAHQQPDAPTTL